jgi:protease-4
MWKALEDAKAKKPVVVSMSDVAASGGYYISCNANKIIAEPSTITGSIGLFLGKPVLRGFYDWLGVSNEYVTKGKNAGLFKETEHWTDDEKKKMLDSAHHIYFDNFVAKVAKGRNKTSDEVDAIGEGRVWTGTQAKSNGLIDEFGGLEKAIDVAKQLANLPADKDVRRVVFPAPRPFFETWFGSDDDSTDAKTQQAEAALVKALPEETRDALRYSQMFSRMSQGDVMLLMPFELKIK